MLDRRNTTEGKDTIILRKQFDNGFSNWSSGGWVLSSSNSIWIERSLRKRRVRNMNRIDDGRIIIRTI